MTGHGSVLDHGLDLVQARRLRDVAAELADVGTGDEGAAVADDDDRLGLRIRPPGPRRRGAPGGRAS